MDPLERREQILSCAVKLFEQSSYAEVSTGQIAAAAGVARPLIHHYFGTKRELYLEVVRRISNLPPMVLQEVPRESRRASVEAIVDHWVATVSRHRRMWLATVNIGGPGGEADAQRIIDQADAAVVDGVLDTLGLDLSVDDRVPLRAASFAFGVMLKEASRQWLVYETLTIDDVRRLAVTTMMALLDEFAPEAA